MRKGRKHTPEELIKMSESHKGKQHSEETKLKMSNKAKQRIGNKNNRYEKHLTTEHKEILRKCNLGKKASKETKELFSQIRKGKNCGETHPNWKNKIKQICPTCNKEFEIKPHIKNRKFCSNKCRGIAHRGKNNPSYGKPRYHTKKIQYNSSLQGEVYLRSSYELAYAKYLDSKKILWMYEIETFNLTNTTYTPDFFLPQFEKFIEVKGWMSNKSQEKINEFLEQYPWDLEILYKEDLIKLGIKL